MPKKGSEITVAHVNAALDEMAAALANLKVIFGGMSPKTVLAIDHEGPVRAQRAPQVGRLVPPGIPIHPVKGTCEPDVDIHHVRGPRKGTRTPTARRTIDT